MSIFGGKSKSTSETKVAPPSPQEIALVNQQLTVAQQQLDAITKLGTFTGQVFSDYLPTLVGEVNKFLPKEQQITGESLGFAGKSVGAQDQLLQSELAAIKQGVSLTPDQEKLISDSANNAIQSGLSDIGAFRDESLRSLAQETSVARGLRPEDTPILDVGGRIVNESSRQAAQLVNNIRSQEAQQRLQYPIQAGEFIAGRTQAQQGLAANTANFVEQLRQQAFNNRLNLMATTGNIGVNTASIAPSPYTLNALVESRLKSAQTTTTTKKSPGLLDFLQGAGSLATGLGALGTGAANVGLPLP